MASAHFTFLCPLGELAKQGQVTNGQSRWVQRIMSEPERPQLSPYQVELEAGKRYAWCRCGRSKKQPFCDGSHEGTGIEPLTFTVERIETALLCGCKDTGDPPFCDGSHLLL
jgi:CDGSH iron-sulfur domain-containing protein 3